MEALRADVDENSDSYQWERAKQLNIGTQKVE
jgi:hypothetical protein